MFDKWPIKIIACSYFPLLLQSTTAVIISRVGQLTDGRQAFGLLLLLGLLGKSASNGASSLSWSIRQLIHWSFQCCSQSSCLLQSHISWATIFVPDHIGQFFIQSYSQNNLNNCICLVSLIFFSSLCFVQIQQLPTVSTERLKSEDWSHNWIPNQLKLVETELSYQNIILISPYQNIWVHQSLLI